MYVVMDEPVFLQSLDQGIYHDTTVKSIEQITSEYLGKITIDMTGISNLIYDKTMPIDSIPNV